MTRSHSLRALILASLCTSLPHPAIASDTRHPGPGVFLSSPDLGGSMPGPLARLPGRAPGPASLAAPDAARSAQPATAGIPDDAGGWLLVAEAVRPDGSRRLVAQRLDALGARVWLPNGTELATGAGSKSDATVASDGAGGLIVAWRDDRADAPGLYAQRVDASGARLWGDDGVAIELADPSPGAPRAAPDGAGGAIVAWHDARLGQYDVYAQRVNSAGTMLWAEDGLRVYANAFDQRDPVIAPDGEGGAILAWEDQRSGLADLFGQRLGPTGARRWGTAGLSICAAAGDQQLPVIATSDTFFVVGWRDTRVGSGLQLYAQRIDRFGVSGWAPDGVVVCGLGGSRTQPALAGDGNGGGFFGWAEQRDTPDFVDVFAQHVDAGGAATWTADGAEAFGNITLPGATGSPISAPAIAPDGSGGVFVAFEQLTLAGNLFDPELICQRLDAGGTRVFAAPGATLSSAPFPQAAPIALPDAAGRCVFAWVDYRTTEPDTYAQRVESDGTPLWTADGVPVHVTPGVQYVPKAVPDAAGGTIVVYLQKVGVNYDLFARRFDASGAPLWSPIPVCTAPGLQADPHALADGAGGVFVLWFDTRNGRGQQYVQHLGPDGTVDWTADGVLVKESPDFIEGGRFVPDGAGGVIVALRQLEQRRNGKYDLWAQRISASGNLVWGDAGMPLTLAANDVPWVPYGTPDGAGGAIFAWETWPFTGSYLLAQRLDAAGQPLWSVNGVLVANKYYRDPAVARFAAPAIVTDGGHGAIVAWEDARASSPNSPDLYMQHLDAAGVATWTAGGVAVATGAGAQYRPGLVADGGDGAIVAWADDAPGAGADLLAQRLGPGGVVQWLGGARTLAAAAGAQDGMALTGDGSGGIVAAWEDGRAGAGALDLYAQRMDANGNALWPVGGVEVCTAPGLQLRASVAADGASGAFVTWMDARDGVAFLARLQHLDASGDTTLARDGVTGALASLARAEVGPDGVRLAWRVGDGGARFEIERRIGDGPWGEIGSALPDAASLVEFQDPDVGARGRRGYRLAWSAGDERVTAGEAWLELPATHRLAIAPPSPHPVTGPLVVEFTLPRTGAAELELFDVRGRRVSRTRREAIAGATDRWMVDAGGRFAPGVYLVRLSQGGASVVRRVCVLR